MLEHILEQGSKSRKKYRARIHVCLKQIFVILSIN